MFLARPDPTNIAGLLACLECFLFFVLLFLNITTPLLERLGITKGPSLEASIINQLPQFSIVNCLFGQPVPGILDIRGIRLGVLDDSHLNVLVVERVGARSDVQQAILYSLLHILGSNELAETLGCQFAALSTEGGL